VITFESVTKKYTDGAIAVDDLSMEFATVVSPCSSALRAGNSVSRLTAEVDLERAVGGVRSERHVNVASRGSRRGGHPEGAQSATIG